MIAQRGNPNLLKALREGAKKVSKMNGVSEGSLNVVPHENAQYVPRMESHAAPLNESEIVGQIQSMSQPVQTSQTQRQVGQNQNYYYGNSFESRNPVSAYPSQMTQQSQHTAALRHQGMVTENAPYNFQKKLYDRLVESVESVTETKEYFNATSSLFTLYALGKLNESVLNKIDEEDLREIRGIIREFKGILDNY